MSIISPKVKTPLGGTLSVLMSAICFSFAGVLVKILPYSSLTINGIRSIFAFLALLVYMKLIDHKFIFNKTVLMGGIFNAAMTITFIKATQMTTAANAIILQFVHPIFIIFLTWMLFRKRPDKKAVITCFFVILGIIFFFFDKLGAGSSIGNILAIASGFFYSVMFLLKQLPDGDFESSLLLGFMISSIVGIPSYLQETIWTPKLWMILLLMGIVQNCFSYIFLSRGLDTVSPITASLTSGIEPILNPVLVAIVCGEMIGPMSFIGAVIVLVSIMTYSILQIRQK